MRPTGDYSMAPPRPRTPRSARILSKRPPAAPTDSSNFHKAFSSARARTVNAANGFVDGGRKSTFLVGPNKVASPNEVNPGTRGSAVSRRMGAAAYPRLSGSRVHSALAARPPMEAQAMAQSGHFANHYHRHGASPFKRVAKRVGPGVAAELPGMYNRIVSPKPPTVSSLNKKFAKNRARSSNRIKLF